MAKRGRPPKAVCKTELVHLRVTLAEKQALWQRAKSLNLTLAELVLASCLPGKTVPSPSSQLSLLTDEAPAFVDEETIGFPAFTGRKALDAPWHKPN